MASSKQGSAPEDEITAAADVDRGAVMTDFDTIVTGLRLWTKSRDNHVKAAVELLIWHEHWLRRSSFLAACVTDHAGGTSQSRIHWDRARDFLDTNPRGSSSELAVLDLAIDIGTDRYGFSHMGHQHRAAIIRTVARALGEETPRG